MTARWNPWRRRLAIIACLAAAALFVARGRWLVGLACLAVTLVPVIAGVQRGRRRYFALAAIAMSAALTGAFVAGIDLYFHYRFADTGGYNIWGYRGAVVGRKRPNERRIVMLGGSVAFGFGVKTNDTIPYYLQQRLNAAGGAPVTVVNLGWNGEGAYSLKYTLDDYDYLDYDTAILYSGYNDLMFNNKVFRHESAVFRMTGYLPILQIIPIREWLHLSNLSDTTTSRGKVVFRPTLNDRYAAEAADTALRISQALDRELARFAPNEPPKLTQFPKDDACPWPWGYYCRAVGDATQAALDRRKQVFIVTEPYKTDQHEEQQTALHAYVAKRFGGNPRVHVIDMGPAVNLRDRRLCYDGLHLTPAGNAQLADRLAPEIARGMQTWH